MSDNLSDNPLPPSGALDMQHDRKAAGAVKHLWFPADKIPMWVADLEFRSPQPVLDAIANAAGKGDFGYSVQPPALPQIVCERLKTHYGHEAPDASRFKWVPGLMVGMGMAARCTERALGESRVVIATPIYAPFMATPARYGAQAVLVPLLCRVDGGALHYGVDWPALEASHGRQIHL
jgi:cystathionine beta-lyase